MNKNHIPQQRIPQERRIGDVSLGKEGFLLFSFKLLERNEYFDLCSGCENWSVKLFELLRDVSKIPLSDLIHGKYGTYRFHSHDNANPPCSFPRGISSKESYQLRIAQSKGGIHGVLVDEVFYVFWLDPLHNMYPMENFGGVKKIKEMKECCLSLREENEKLKDENKHLKEDCDVYEGLLSKNESGKE